MTADRMTIESLRQMMLTAPGSPSWSARGHLAGALTPSGKHANGRLAKHVKARDNLARLWRSEVSA